MQTKEGWSVELKRIATHNLRWKAVDFVILVSNRDQRLDQKVLRNLLSWLEMMVCGIPKWTHTWSKKILTISIWRMCGASDSPRSVEPTIKKKYRRMF
jgi:hypothetical protein